MGIQFFIVGGVIFATYMGLTIWNIILLKQKAKGRKTIQQQKVRWIKKGLS